jgi:hypothetical protein
MANSECTACGADLDQRDHFPGCGNGTVELWVISEMIDDDGEMVAGAPLASVVPGEYPMSAVRQYVQHNDAAHVLVRKQSRPSNLLPKG